MFLQARGRGYWIPAILFGSLLLMDWLTGFYYHDPTFYAHHRWPKLAAFTVAALILWYLSAHRDDEYLPGAKPADEKGPFLRPQDSFFWVPAKIWPALSLALGLLFYFIHY